MPLDEIVVAAVGNANFKIMAELGVQNAISNQQQLNILGQKSLAKSLEAMDTLSVPEGLGISAANRSDLAKVMTEMLASVKAGGNIPPVTP